MQLLYYETNGFPLKKRPLAFNFENIGTNTKFLKKVNKNYGLTDSKNTSY
jgi:hypothetical protein